MTVFERRRRNDRRISTLHPLADDLAAAMAAGELEVLIQPQFAAIDQSLVGGEALIRWHHKERGDIGGEELIGIAFRSKLTEKLSRYVMQQSLKIASTWPGNVRLSLNVTAFDIAAHDFVEHVSEALEEAGFPPERLTLEITEQALMQEVELAAGRLERLALLGIRIALDDFGTGYSNFRYLKALPLHCLKLDRSMIEGVAHDERDLAVLRGIVAMANALGLSVIAEGVESEEQLAVIVREGVTKWQGFLGSEPMEADRFAELATGSDSEH